MDHSAGGLQGERLPPSPALSEAPTLCPPAYLCHGLDGPCGRLHAEVLRAQTQRGMAGVPFATLSPMVGYSVLLTLMRQWRTYIARRSANGAAPAQG